MTWGIIVGSTIAAGGAIYAGSQANAAASSAAGRAWRRQLSLLPDMSDSGLQQLLGQEAYAFGASPDQLRIDLLSNQIEANGLPGHARDFRTSLGIAQQLLAQGQPDPASRAGRRWGQDFNGHFGAVKNFLQRSGVGTAEIVDGKIVLRSSDPGIEQLVAAAARDGSAIRENRLNAQSDLSRLAADFPTATAEELDALAKNVRESQIRDIDFQTGRQSDQVLQQANARGFNPAGILGELERARSNQTRDTEFTASERALQILQGRQTGALGSIAGINAALSPERFLALLQAQNPSNQANQQAASTVGQLAAAQAAGGAARAQGTASAASGIGDTLTILGLLYGKNANETKKGPGATPTLGNAGVLQELLG